MGQFYIDPSREADPHALPDAEAFYFKNDGKGGHSMKSGWYWWPCFPGCMPDGEANGPFTSRDAAIADARSS